MRAPLNLLYILLFIGLPVLDGCQSEITEVIEPSADEVFTPATPIARLIMRTSMRDGSYDNILDGSSCTSIKLPVTIVVDDQEISIETADDFSIIEELTDEPDDDVVEFIFPIIVILPDHAEVVVSSEDDLESMVDACSGNEDDDIECVDFIFPIAVATYDADNQVSDVITVDSDKELFKFIQFLGEDDLIGIDYPISVVLPDKTELTIENNTQLEHALKNAINACDEDDDNDDADDAALIEILIDGNWVISSFFDNTDKTANFEGYLFTFFQNGNAVAQKGGFVVEGSWSSSGAGDDLELELDFGDDPPLDALEESWDVFEFDERRIALIGRDGSETDELVLERLP
ncbi:MAG: hypothetical protein MI975_11985 [Cytophagales bacterium]|nr:hypothetical protein [Cytophagales bacterium]